CLKKCMTEAPLLRHYDQNKTVYLRCDCSDVASGVVLLLKDENGDLHPFQYYSKHLSDCQRRYSTTSKEYLSVVLATKAFRNFLLDKKFIVMTDHKPLLRAKRFKNNRQLEKFDILLSEFDFDAVYVSAKNVV